MQIRRSGILLHITSLPSPYGIGDFGAGAYRFADFLSDARQTVWQVLPLIPSSPQCGNSPYCGFSAFAGNPLFICPSLLAEEGLLLQSDIENPPPLPHHKVEYGPTIEYKYRLLEAASRNHLRKRRRHFGFERFCYENDYWLDDYALFVALRKEFGAVPWCDWPHEVRDRTEPALGMWKSRLKKEILAEKFFQYLFFSQWSSLKHYCNSRNIQVVGDMPIYVSYDSADVWANSWMFKLDEEKRPTFVAGVPPDYFSTTGQLWGNPVYRWDRLRESRYAWWIRRLEHSLNLFDAVRLDHFRGLVGYWEVPAFEPTAMHGKWAEVPSRDFFDTLLRRFSRLPIIAEDLGTITPDVREIMARYEFPGMKVLLFAFGDDLSTNPYVPHNHIRKCVVYTGTHDNNTARGWFRTEATLEDKERLCKYLGRTVSEETVHLELVRTAMMSVSDMAIIPMQDILGLGEEARMNLPAVSNGNWEWRFTSDEMNGGLSQYLAEITRTYGRG
jgi:4-alpha-glucanotransferase